MFHSAKDPVARWRIRLTRLTLVCEVIRYRLVQVLVQVRQNLKKELFFVARLGDDQGEKEICLQD